VAVDRLFIFDTPAPVFKRDKPVLALDDAGWLCHIAKRIGELNGVAINLQAEAIRGLPIDAQLVQLKAALVAGNILPEYFEISGLKAFFATLKAVQHIAYAPTAKLAMDMVFFRAADNDKYIGYGPEDEGMYEALAAPDYKWSQLVTGRITAITVPGDHDSILAEPNVTTLAHEMNALIGNAKQINYSTEML
jgi:thioesterase domain-containing protein